jgi:hypothetical protein
MNKLTIIICAVLMIGCLENVYAAQREIIGPKRAKLIEIAQQELKRRHLPLPRDYDVVVENGKIITELDEPVRKVYGVWFRFTYWGKRDMYYSFLIDRRDKIIQVSDLRHAKVRVFGE